MHRNLTILLVDDSPDFRKDFSEWLQDLGHLVIEAAGSREALALFHANRGSVDVALVDYALGVVDPVGDGIALLRQLRQIDEHLPVIVATGFGEQTVSQRALREGAFWYLEKPIDFVEAEALLRWVAHYHTTSERISVLREQAADTHPLVATSHLIEARGIPSLFEAVRTKAQGLLRADRCGILRIDPETGDVRSATGAEGAAAQPVPEALVAIARELIFADGNCVTANLDFEADGARFQSYGACFCPPQKGASEILFALFETSLADEMLLGLELRLLALARIVGVALENLRKTQLLEALVDSGKQLLTAREREQVFQIIREQVVDKLGVSTFYLMLHNRASDVLRCSMYIFQGEDITGRIPPFDLAEVDEGRSYTVFILKNNQELAVDDTNQEVVVENAAGQLVSVRPYPIPGTETGCYFGVPLRRPDGSSFGVLAIEKIIPGGLSDSHKQALRVLATLVSPTLSRLWRARLQQLLLRKLISGNPEAALQDSLRSAWEAVNADFVAFYPYDSRREMFRFPQALSAPGGPAVGKPDEDEIASLARLVQNSEHFAENAADDDQFGDVWARRYGARSLASVTVSGDRDDKPVGVVLVHYRRERVLTDELKADIRRFSQFTALAAHVLDRQDRSRLAERQRSAIERLMSISDRSQVQETLEEVIQKTWPDHKIHCRLLLADRGERRLVDPACAPGDANQIPFGQDLVGRAAETGEPLLAQDRETLLVHRPVFDGTRSACCVPVKLGDSLLGVIDIETAEHDFFQEEDLAFFEQIAKSVAPTLVAASRKEYTEKVLEAARRAARDPERGLEIIAESVHQIATSAGGAPTSTTVFLLTGKDLELAGAWPPEQYEGLWATVGSLPLEPGPGKKLGIVARAFNEKKTQFIPDVRREEDYIAFDKDTRAELAVPVLTEGPSAIGVLNLEYGQPGTLEIEHESLVESLADQTRIVAILQEQQRDLAAKAVVLAEEQKKKAIAAALAFAGLRATHRAHALDALDVHLEGFQAEVKSLRQAWAEFSSRPHPRGAAVITESIATIETYFDLLSRRDVEESSQEDAEDKEMVAIGPWAEDLARTWENLVSGFCSEISVEARTGVLANRFWLTKGIENLLFNSREALKGRDGGRVLFSVSMSGNTIRVAVEDNGPGIHDSVAPFLFSGRVPGRSRDHGLGCLLTNFIIQLYDGRILPIESGSWGTRITVELPFHPSL